MGAPLPAIASTNWNQLADPIFNTKRSDGSVHPSAADNQLIAWPELFKMLPQRPALELLDFGCGTGDFANALVKQGHTVVGLDLAADMVVRAKKNYPELSFVAGSIDALRSDWHYDAITAVMVFQFVENHKLEELFTKLICRLKPEGRLIFAVHNRDYIEAAKAKTQKYFVDPAGQSRIQFANFGSIPFVARTADEYTALLERLGMKQCALSLPAFTQEYIALYGSKGNEPLDTPKFLIMSFSK